MTQQPIDASALEKAALIIRQLKEKVERLERKDCMPIAVVGMACRFPGNMNSAADFWNGLLNGIDTVGSIPANRWEQNNNGKKLYGSFIENIEAFDAAFFGISPREAKAMDPQQRLLMETSWHALEDAGIKPSELKATDMGVFIGAMSHDYSEWSYEEGVVDVYTGTGTSNSILAGRLAHYYDLHGPAMTIDTACSSSLVAIHQAVRSLRQGESTACIVAGVNAILSPSLYNIEIANQMLAPDGRCKTFDASANGFARGEGVGVVILKRLEDAIINNDRIYCVIPGSAINHDGRSTGLMAPSQQAQEKLLQTALKDARLSENSIGFVECHGTGTSLGDPVEVSALQEVYGKNRNSVLQLGAVKSNLGHLEGAAGIAGFIKMALSVYHSVIPPNIHFKKLNTYIDSKNIDVPTKSVQWSGQIRTGGVSSFGFSGTNAHVIVQSYSLKTGKEDITSVYMPFAFSASSVAALNASISANNAGGFTDAKAYTLSCRKDHMAYRKLFFNTNNIAKGQPPLAAAEWLRTKPQVVFLFSGQGSQFKDMGLLLYKFHPRFKKYFDECNQVYKAITGADLMEYVFGEKAEELNSTVITQPALFAVSYAIARTWQEHGLEPFALIGHSIGEWAAACFAGMLSLKDAIALVVKRAQLMEASEQGSMYAIATTCDTVLQHAKKYKIDIAAINAPEQIVISGKNEHVEGFVTFLTTLGIKSSKLNVKRAFHSRLMDDAAKQFGEVVNDVVFSKPQYNIYNNIDGTALNVENIKDGYWQQQITSLVNYKLCTEKIPEGAIIIEMGPGNTLLQLAIRNNVNTPLQLPGMCTNTDAQSFYKSFTTLFEKGFDFKFNPFFSDKHIPISLQPYVFQRVHYWIKNEVKILLKRNVSPVLNEPAAYRRQWVPIQPTGEASRKCSVRTFVVDKEIHYAQDILFAFASILNRSVENNEKNVVVVTALQYLEKQYRYPIGMALLSCLQSAMLEYPDAFMGILLQMDDVQPSMEDLDRLFTSPSAVLSSNNEFSRLSWHIAIEKGNGIQIEQDKVYVIHGGSGSVGLELAKYIAAEKGGHIILSGRRALAQLDMRHQAFMHEAKQNGVSIEYCTINDIDEYSEVLKKNGKKLGGFFNASGSYNNLSIAEYSQTLVLDVLKPKINDTIQILKLCKEHQADFLVNCSSAVTMTGAPMLGHYAFANAFMDGLAEQEQGINIYSIAWGGWKDSNMLSDANNEAFQKQWGFTAAEAKAMINAFRKVSPGCTAIVNIDWKRFFIAAPGAAFYQPFEAFSENKKQNITLPATKIWTRRDVSNELYKTLRNILQAEDNALEYTLPFDELGFNSLLALELSTALNTLFDTSLSSTVVYEYTTPQRLANYLADILIHTPVLSATTSPTNTSKVLIEEDVDDLSLEELKALLDKKISH